MSAKAEQIARMLGKTTYKDFRQGFSRTVSLDADSDSDIKGALGIAQREAGHIAVMALETHYAATTRYEGELRRAWDLSCGKPDDPSFYPIRRLGCSLAIMEHVGLPASQREVKEWAWILHTNYERLDAATIAATSWLQDLTSTAMVAFLKAIHRPD